MKKTVFFLLVFLVVGGYMIKDSLNTDFDETEDKISFFKEFFDWIFQVGRNVNDVTGYASQQEWLPEVNDTNNTDSSLED